MHWDANDFASLFRLKVRDISEHETIERQKDVNLSNVNLIFIFSQHYCVASNLVAASIQHLGVTFKPVIASTDRMVMRFIEAWSARGRSYLVDVNTVSSVKINELVTNI